MSRLNLSSVFRPSSFVLSASLSRYLLLLVARQPSARPGGLGADFALGLTPKVFILAALIPLVLILFDGWRALVAAALAYLVAFVIIRLARARLGGVTGDVLGLTVELTELIILLTFIAQVPSFPSVSGTEGTG